MAEACKANNVHALFADSRDALWICTPQGLAVYEHDALTTRTLPFRTPEALCETPDGSVYVEDVTSAYTCIGLWGPDARAILQKTTPSDLGNTAFPFMTAQEIAIGTVPRPSNWSGFRLRPLIIEFWQDRPYRLHDRIEFRRGGLGEPWRKTRLYP